MPGVRTEETPLDESDRLCQLDLLYFRCFLVFGQDRVLCVR